VVVGEDPGTKRAEAEAEGVRRLDEAAFKRLLADEAPRAANDKGVA
jgi:NAD-dependent DNA ligase